MAAPPKLTDSPSLLRAPGGLTPGSWIEGSPLPVRPCDHGSGSQDEGPQRSRWLHQGRPRPRLTPGRAAHATLRRSDSRSPIAPFIFGVPYPSPQRVERIQRRLPRLEFAGPEKLPSGPSRSSGRSWASPIAGNPPSANCVGILKDRSPDRRIDRHCITCCSSSQLLRRARDPGAISFTP